MKRTGKNDPAPRVDPRHAASIRRAVLSWYRAAKRDLPWRDEPDPYRVWIAEIMAQQTRIETVVSYFERFVARFPDLASLAAADVAEVLALWSGLGYYSRARNLHACARAVVETFGGRMPCDPALLATLPGIGRYTAGAIASIACGVPAPIVDGNVVRVLSRLFDVEGDTSTAPVKRRLWSLAGTLVDPDAPGDFNQSMMELGATVCTPTSPACAACPVRRSCRALAAGTVDRRPLVPAKKPPATVRLVAAAVRREDGAILLIRRDVGRLFRGMWTLPLVESIGRKPGAGSVEAETGLSLTFGGKLGRVEHTLSHRHLVIDVYDCRPAVPIADADGRRWVAGERGLAVIGVPRLTRKLLAAAGLG